MHARTAPLQGQTNRSASQPLRQLTDAQPGERKARLSEGRRRQHFASESRSERSGCRYLLSSIIPSAGQRTGRKQFQRSLKYPLESPGRPDAFWQTAASTPPPGERGRRRSLLCSPESQSIPRLLETGAFCTKKLPRRRRLGSQRNRKGRV